MPLPEPFDSGVRDTASTETRTAIDVAYELQQRLDTTNRETTLLLLGYLYGLIRRIESRYPEFKAYRQS